MGLLSERVKRAKHYFYNLVEEYDEKELYNAIKRARNDFSYLEPYWQNLILKAEALEQKINEMPPEEKREYIRELDIERKRNREAVWEKNLTPAFKKLLEKIKRED